jgi:hypothetical protein
VAKQILANVRLFTGAADLTSASNKVEVAGDVEDVDVTTFKPDGSADSGWREFLGGLRSAEIAGEGFWEAGDPGQVDDAAWAQLGGRGPWTIAPAGAADGALAYTGLTLQGAYTLFGEIGAAAPWSLKGMSSGAFARGVIAHPPGVARSASGTGVARNLGAVAAGRRLNASLHVLSVTGSPTITARVESDDTSGFASPITQLTFAAATAPGGQFLALDGPVAGTETWWRAAWTISGTGSVLFVVALGIA